MEPRGPREVSVTVGVEAEDAYGYFVRIVQGPHVALVFYDPAADGRSLAWATRIAAWLAGDGFDPQLSGWEDV